jgi:hypothetical protein
MYPLQRGTTWKTKVLRFLNDKEQRFVQQTPKQDFVLTYTGVDASSLATLKTFWVSMHGADISVFDLNLGTDFDTSVSMHYYNLVFIDDDFTATQTKPNRWDVKLKIRAVS